MCVECKCGTGHDGHQVMDISVAKDGIREQLNTDVLAAACLLKKVNIGIEDLKSYRNDLKKKMKTVKAAVHNSRDQLIEQFRRIVDLCMHEQLDKLSQFEKVTEATIQLREENGNCRQGKIYSFI